MASPGAHELFGELVDEFSPRDGVDLGPMFGSAGLRIRGKVFAFVASRDVLAVKVPAKRASELEAGGTAPRMVMGERVMRQWVAVPVEAHDLWPLLAEEALAFVDSITP